MGNIDFHGCHVDPDATFGTRDLVGAILIGGPVRQLDFGGAIQAGLVTALGRLPVDLRRTLTWHQGKELALHQQLADQIGTKVYFCDAH